MKLTRHFQPSPRNVLHLTRQKSASLRTAAVVAKNTSRPSLASHGVAARAASTTVQLDTQQIQDVDGNAADALAAGLEGPSVSGTEEATTVNEERVEAYTLQDRKPLAGGFLDLIYLEKGRMLRVWTPPGYSRAETPKEGYPVLFLNDGQNLFDDSMSFSGSSWRAADTAAELITTGQLPAFVVVGIDHAGANRSLEYLPYKPGTGPKSFRPDAAQWPGGEVEAYLKRVVEEIVPFASKQYGCSTDPALRAFGGSSFGGICTLCAAMQHPGAFGALLVESPSLWFAEERFLTEDIAAHDWSSCPRMFVGMGGREYSGIRKPDQAKPEFDKLLAGYVPTLVQSLVKAEKGMDPAKLKYEVEDSATHTESSWAKRLPRTLKFLLSGWWEALSPRYRHSLYFTSPRKPKAGQPMVLFFNKKRSSVLAESESVRLLGGFNDWQVGKLELTMQQAPHLPAVDGAEWWMLPMAVPDNAYEFNFALSDGRDTWDNNAGNNFYLRVKALSAQLGDGGAAQSTLSAVEAAVAAANSPAHDVASTKGHKLFFTMPEIPVAGAPVALYVNKMRSWALADSPNVRVHYGFNNWELGSGDTDCKPTNLWRWSSRISLPEGVTELSMVFNNGADKWDSNSGNNYTVPVKDMQKEAVVVARTIASEESMPHGAGTMHILKLDKRVNSTKASKWYEEKLIRVWTPPGYDRANPPPGGYPVLYFNDGQNIFEDWLAHQGVSWRLGYTASDLVCAGKVPPFVIVATDSPGAMRSYNFLPYPPGSGVGGFRGDCERWPGGGLDPYMHRLTDEIMPMAVQRFGLATDPSKVAFGGGSFAGICALYAAMHYGHVFGAVLAESPSLWVTEARFLADMAQYRGMMTERIFIGCGTKEYSATRDHVRDDVDALLLHYYCEAARLLGEKGMRGERMRFLVEDGAGHHELAWQWRLTGALEFLLAPWWDA